MLPGPGCLLLLPAGQLTDLSCPHVCLFSCGILQVLHRLGHWPCGLWHSTSGPGQPPRGRLVLAAFGHGMLRVQQVECGMGQAAGTLKVHPMHSAWP